MKKGFTLVELLVSLVIISLVMVFISSFILNLKDDKGKIILDIPQMVDQAAISKNLNEDAIKYGIESITLESNKKCRISYNNDLTGIVEINGKNIKYTIEDNIVFARTLQGNISFTQIYFDSNNVNYYEDMSGGFCTASAWTKTTKTCNAVYAYSAVTTPDTTYDSCTVSSNIPSECTSSNANTTYITACSTINMCRSTASSNRYTCVCYAENGDIETSSCVSSSSQCATRCDLYDTPTYEVLESSACGCSSGGEYNNGYCYKESDSCSSPWTAYTKYHKSQKTCEATYSYSEETSTTVTSNCSASINIPSTCSASNVNVTYITKDCVALSPQCSPGVNKKYFRYVIGLSSGENIEVYYYGD